MDNTGKDTLEVIADAVEYLDEYTEYLGKKYGIDMKPADFRFMRGAWACIEGTRGYDSQPQISYGIDCILGHYIGDIDKYGGANWIWDDLSHTLFHHRGLWALAIHEFSHVLDYKIYGPPRHGRGGKRILHGTRFIRCCKRLIAENPPPSMTVGQLKMALNLRDDT